MRSELRSLGFITALASTIALVAACAEPPADDGDTGSEDSETGEPGDGDPGDGDGDPGDGDPGDGDGDPGDGDGDPGDGDGDAEACAPPDEDVFFGHAPFEFGLDPWDADVDWTCTVEQVDTSGGLYLALDCPEAMQPIELDITSSPAFVAPLVGGETVQLRFVSEGPFWFNEYLRLDVEGHGHLLTMVDGDGLVPPPEVYDFPLPHATEPIYDACPWIPDFCGQLERLRLSFDVDAQTYEVLDGNYAVLGPAPGTEVWVVEAGRLHEIDCTDTPNEWFRLMFVNL